MPSGAVPQPPGRVPAGGAEIPRRKKPETKGALNILPHRKPLPRRAKTARILGSVRYRVLCKVAFSLREPARNGSLSLSYALSVPALVARHLLLLRLTAFT
jgi:hypothetical protein